jgi:IS1 family transposase
MNRLSEERRAQIIGLLVEGNSLRSASHLMGVSINTVTKLLVDVGAACDRHLRATLVNLRCRRIQCDEIWSFVYAKEKNVTPKMEATKGWARDVWTWTALDPDSKLMVSWLVGKRDAGYAQAFTEDIAHRLANRVQLTTDGNKLYLAAVEDAFGMDVDYAMLVKLYGQPEDGERTYSPAICIGCRKTAIMGNPDADHISTSMVERQNLTMRMSMRRFTRPTNAFSKKVENHEAAVALYVMHYNFARIHKTLRVTPAMEAGVSDHVWSLAEIARLAK